MAVAPALQSATIKNDTEIIEKGFYKLDFIKGTNPKLILTSPNNDKKINLAERKGIRLNFQPESLYMHKFDKQSSVRLDAFEVIAGKRKYIGSQTVTLGRARKKVSIGMELGYFAKSSKDIEIDLYDTENRLVNTYGTKVTAEFLGAQPAIASADVASNPKAECSPGAFDDCYIEHILKRIVFEARPQDQITTRIIKAPVGKYIVTLPVPTESFRPLRESKFKAKITNPDGTQGIITTPTVSIGDTDAEFAEFAYDDSKHQLELFFNGNEASSFSFNREGRIGIGVDPTAFLDIQGGTSSTPQIKLRPGTLTTAPQNGSIEYDGNNFYFTNNNARTPMFGPGGLGGSTTTSLLASQIVGVLGPSQLPASVVYTNTLQTLTLKTLQDPTVILNSANGASLKIVQGAAAGKVLTSDAFGFATWANPTGSSGGGEYTNNGDTAGADRLLGNLDDQGLSLITNGIAAIAINDNGSVGIGTLSPNTILSTNGSLALKEMASIPGPTLDWGKLYVKPDSKLYYMNGSGIEFSLTNSPSLGDPGGNTTIAGTNTTINGALATTPTNGMVDNDISLSPAKTIMRVTGNGDALTDLTTKNPQIADGVDGQILIIRCNLIGTQKIKFYDGRGLDLASASVTLNDKDTLTLVYDQVLDVWVEVSRSLN